MSAETVMAMTQVSIETMLKISGPLLLSGLLVGLLVGVFQAVTQIQEMTLTFIPKILVTVLILMLSFPWMLQIMIDFTTNLYDKIPDVVR